VSVTIRVIQTKEPKKMPTFAKTTVINHEKTSFIHTSGGGAIGRVLWKFINITKYGGYDSRK
jgi:hypothetical protein